MTDDASWLAAVRAVGGDRTVRLVYADYLDERGDPRGELVRVCEAMRRTPVFADDYWRLKARRNELRAACPADWLAATGYDGSDYDPVFRDGVPGDWRGRWRLIREFTERWHGIPLGDVGGRADEVRAEEQRLGLTLPPSVRELVAFAHDVTPNDQGYRWLLRDPVTLELIPGRDALSLVEISEGDWHWGSRLADLTTADPPVFNYHWRSDMTEEETEEREQEADSVTLFTLNVAMGYMPTAGWFSVRLADCDEWRNFLRTQLRSVPPILRSTESFEGEQGLLVEVYDDPSEGRHLLSVYVRSKSAWDTAPDFLHRYVERAANRSGVTRGTYDGGEIPF